MNIFLGLDIGGTKIMAAAADEHGTLLRRVRAETPAGLADGLTLLRQMTTNLVEDDTLLAVGAAVGGPLDPETGIVSPLHQPSWRNVPLKAILEAEFGSPFFVDVDTNAGVLAEVLFGGETASRLLYLTLSTGMGGGFLVDGQIYRGSDGRHPEPAHQGVAFRCAHPERVVCDCGACDCLEALVSGAGIRRVYGQPAEELSVEEWSEVAFNLGLGLRNLAVILAPDAIVLGGGVAVGGGEPFLAQARRVMEERLFLVAPPRLSLSRLGCDTALLGAVALARSGYANRYPGVSL